MRLLVLVALLAALLTAGPAEAATVLGTEERALRRYDPLTLEARGRALRLPSFVWTWAHDPEYSRLAVAVRGRRPLLIVEGDPLRRVGEVPLGVRGQVTTLAWPRPDRVVALVAGGDASLRAFVVVDPVARRVVARHRVRGAPAADAAHWEGGLAVVSGPVDDVGPARLLVAGADGPPGEIPLPGVEAGFEPPPPNAPPDRLPTSRTVNPGLAIDPAGARAVVLSATAPLAVDVDLGTGAAIPHPLGVAAAKVGESRMRMARFSAPGTLLVAGLDEEAEPRYRLRSFGLRRLDLATWTLTTVTPGVRYFQPAAGALLLPWYDRDRRDRRRHTGVAVLDADGRVQRTLFRGRRPTAVDVAAGRVYARFHRAHETLVADLATGRTLRRLGRAQLPLLMEGPALP